MKGAVVALVAALAVASCGSGDDVRSSAEPESTTSTAPSPGTEADEAAGWCSTWHELIALVEGPDPDPAVFEAALVAARTDAPDEIRDAVEWMVDGFEEALARGEDETAEVGSFDFAAISALATWGHEACGDPPPLCALWPSFTGALAVLAFSDMPSDEQDVLLQEYRAVTFAHLPEELAEARSDLEAFGPPGYPEDLEPAAELAHDAVDAWVDRSCDP